MFYFDCACHHDRFREFQVKEKALEHFHRQVCPTKLIYQETNEGFKTIIEIVDGSVTTQEEK